MKKKILFIDRDGNLVKEPFDQQVDSLDKIVFCSDVFVSLLQLKSMGYEFVMVSNQDGLGTESFPEEKFELCQKFIIDAFSSQNIVFSEVFICPHFEKDNCSCRKPKAGLLTQYLVKTDIDLQRSYVIGDRVSDLDLAKNLGVKGIKYLENESWLEIVEKIKNLDDSIEISRKTKETEVFVKLKFNGRGQSNISTTLPFFDHMLEQISSHGKMDLNIKAIGDTQIDDHHLIEDVAIALGQAFLQVTDQRKSIERYSFVLPMDESTSFVALDLGTRFHFKFSGEFSRDKIQGFSTEMISHFFRSLSEKAQWTLHMKVEGDNDHHKVESLFKAFARCLRQSSRPASVESSTKGEPKWF